EGLTRGVASTAERIKVVDKKRLTIGGAPAARVIIETFGRRLLCYGVSAGPRTVLMLYTTKSSEFPTLFRSLERSAEATRIGTVTPAPAVAPAPAVPPAPTAPTAPTGTTEAR